MIRRQGNTLSRTKRGNNEGSIIKRSDGRWMARLTLPDGTRKTIYAKTRQEASRLLASAIREETVGYRLWAIARRLVSSLSRGS
jgi:hypothetical protein